MHLPSLLHSLPLHLISPLLLIILPLHVLQFSRETLNFVFVLVDLRLVHVEFCGHGFHLVGFFFKVLLVDGELLGDFGTRLTGEEGFELDIELLLLLNHDVFFHDFFSLFDKAFLKGLDLLKELPSVGVGALKLPPPVIIQRVLQLLRQSLHLQPFIKELLVERESFFLQLIDLRSLRLDNLQFAG